MACYSAEHAAVAVASGAAQAVVSMPGDCQMHADAAPADAGTDHDKQASHKDGKPCSACASLAVQAAAALPPMAVAQLLPLFHAGIYANALLAHAVKPPIS